MSPDNPYLRDMLIQHMIEVYDRDVDIFGKERAMGNALSAAEKFYKGDEDEIINFSAYAARGLLIDDESLNRALALVFEWVRRDANKQIKKEVTLDDCVKLARKFALFM